MTPNTLTTARRPIASLALGLLSLALAAAGAFAGASHPATAAKPEDIGVVIIKKVVVNDPADTTAYSGTIIKAQGNQLIAAFTTLAQGADLRYTGLANGTYDIAETEPTLLGYWKADGDATCPAAPSTRPNQDKAVISDVVKLVTVCVFNGPLTAGDDTISSSVTPGDDPSGNDTDDSVTGGDDPSGDTPGSNDPVDGSITGNEDPSGDTPGSNDPVDGSITGGDAPSGDTPGGDNPVDGSIIDDDPSADTPGGDDTNDSVIDDDPSGGTPGGDDTVEDVVAGDDSQGDTPADDDDDDLLVLIIEDSPDPGAGTPIIDEVSSHVSPGPLLTPSAPSTGTGLQDSAPSASTSLLLFALAFLSAGAGLATAAQHARD